FPLWLSKIWIKNFGFEKSLKLCDAINQIPPITVRANSLKTDRKALAAIIENFAENVTLTEHAENGISFTRPSMPIADMQAFKDGFFQVQDEAAQLITSILDPKPGENILDACAGLGGKTGHAGQLMKNQGNLTAWDINKNKLSSLESEMKRVGITIVKTRQMDLLETTKNEYHNSFDRVLVDAPCTGLGVLRRNPDSKWSRCKNDITRLAKIQSCMLLNAAELVKPGGTLVYAVCSCHPLENEELIIPFLKKRDDFFINKNIPCLDKSSNRGKDQFHNTGMDKFSNTNLNKLYNINKLYNKGMISDNGFFRTYPDNLFMDGFFAVSMQRKK
ncbi:MAG: methyltransferase domain-containing protein, partial [Thermodesulfobacteriota bacterium]|nr:methyltransferase domain-containing protein [Thermodesulfobacteriota bacterium]